MERKSIQKNPWAWIPTLYVAEGLPYFAVNTLTILMFHEMGVGMAKMAYLTGWLYLPWVIKPFWSPFLDLFSTKKRWILLMQLLIGVCLGGVAFSLSLSDYLTVSLIFFWLMAFCSATHDIGADGFYIIALSGHEQAQFVGIRSTFYRIASVIGQGGIVILAGYLETTTRSVSTSWGIVFMGLSAIFFLFSLYHYFSLPVVSDDHPINHKGALDILKGFGNAFLTFFQRRNIASALAFMLLYRLPEALCIKIVQPFLVSGREVGGLGLTTSEVGFVNGTAGVIALLLGGIAGGVVIGKNGLKRWLWPMAMSLTLPCIFYCFLAMWQPDSLHLITLAVFVEQFGYGFGFSAYMLYLLYFSQGENSTSHYAFCTAFMALGMMIPGMFAGWIFENVAIWSQDANSEFINFFWIVMLSCFFTFLVCKIVKIDSAFGRK